MRGHSLRRLTELLLAVVVATGVAMPPLSAQGSALVRGTVLAADSSEPIASANVVVKGTTIGTQTDALGAFALRVPSPDVTLVISRLGFARQEVALAGRTAVQVTLRRTSVSLTEVVVVGYGTQKRSDITGSVTSVSTARIEEKPNVNIGQALEGSMPGVTVSTTGAGAEPSLDILVRGRNSISASTAPLVVVDGIPYNGELSDLNPEDIQSIEVLKDASATAIYGTRGSNGVILITSRKGTTGKSRVTYSGYVGTQTVTGLPALMDAQQFADFKCVRIRATPTQACSTTLTPTELRNQAAGVNTDWLRIGTRQGNQQNHELSIGGGSEDTKYYLGASVLRVNGIALNDQFNRATVRVNLDQKIRPWLSVGTNTQGSRTVRDGMPVSFVNAFSNNPLITPFDSVGNELLVPWPEDPTVFNVLDNLHVIDEDRNNRVFSSNYLEASTARIPGLTYRLNAGLDLADRNAGRYSGRNTQAGLVVGGQGRTAGSRRNDWTLENVLRYNRTIGRGTLDLTGLLSHASNSYSADTVRTERFPNDVLGFRSNLPLSTTPDYRVVESRLVSQMGRINYSFDERYLMTLTARRDGYSGFGRNNKYGVFPSLALGWNVHNETFFPWKETVDALKLRFSYGKNGNQAIQPYQTFAQLDDRSYLNGSATAPGYIPVTLGNPDLRWETTLSKNLGVDLSLWHERVRVTADAYSASTSDLLLRRGISSVHGIGVITQNIGRTENRGFELELNTLNLSRGGFEWRTDMNVSVNRNQIVDLYGDQTNDIVNGWFIGSPIDVNYGLQFGGVWQVGEDATASPQPTAKPGDVKVVDLNGDGKIDASDRTFIGSLEPRYIGGMTNSLRYRGFTMSAFLNTVQGITRANNLLETNQVFTDVRRNMVYRQWWTPETPINTYPANSNLSNLNGVAFYEDASFVRLKDVTLSYDLPGTLATQLGAQTARIYANGRNLWTKTAWSGLDPEFANDSSHPFRERAVPLERVVTAGLTLRF